MNVANGSKPREWGLGWHRKIPGAAAFLFFELVASAALPSERVARVLEVWKKPDAPGMAWVVVSNSMVLDRGALGLSNIEQRSPITTSTRFNIGSISKQFTALGVLKLQRQGKLSIEDLVSSYVPELPDYRAKITLRHLLHHESGLQDWDQLLHLAGWRLDDVIRPEQVLHLIVARKELNFHPGDRFAYSNSGYSVLATVIERVTHTQFSEWMRVNVFQALALNKFMLPDEPGLLIPQRADSYLPARGGRFKRMTDNAAIPGAGSIYCSIDEFADYLRAFDDPVRGKELAALNSWSQLNDGSTNNYASGVEIGRYRGRQTVSHGGGWAGFRTSMLRFPQEKLGIALFSNLGSVEPAPLVSRMADIYLGLQSEDLQDSAANQPREIDVDPEALDLLVGRYELAPGIVIHITKEDNQLMSEATGFPREPMFAQSRTSFFFKVENSTMTFSVQTNGTVAGLVLNRQGQSMSARRLKNESPERHLLAEYEGDYVNTELATKFSARIRNGRLMLFHSRQEDVELTPGPADVFLGNHWWISQLVFKRDAGKNVTEFEVSGARIRPVIFTKGNEK